MEKTFKVRRFYAILLAAAALTLLAASLFAQEAGTGGEEEASRFAGPLGVILVFLAGAGISFTPCVWPMYPITSSVIINSGEAKTKKSAFFLSLTYVLGLAAIYTVLGGVTGALGAAASVFLKSVWIVLFVSIVLFVFGLSMLGLFEIRMPASWSAKLSAGKKKGYAGVFFMGVVSGVVMSPCITPAVAGVIAFVIKSGSWIVGAYIFFAFAMGVGSLLIVIGTFSGALKTLPKPGPWMLWVKRAFGVVMIGLAVWLAWPTLSSAMSAEDKKAGAAPRSEKEIAAAMENGEVRAAETPEATRPEGIDWIHDVDEGLEKARAQGLPAMIDFTADWCTYCKELDKKTFPDPQVVEESRRFVMIKLDATRPTGRIRELMKKYSVTGFPTLVFIDSEGGVHPLVGFVKPDRLLEFMKEIE